MIHVVSGESAVAALKNTFRETGDSVIGLPIDFSVGPITAIHLEDGIVARAEWEASSFHPINKRAAETLSIYQRSLQKLKDIKDGDQLTIWTCENAAEQIGLRLTCFLLASKQVELSIVNTHHAMNEYLKDKEIQQAIRHTGECNAKQLEHFYKHSSRPITEGLQAAFEQDGKNLLQSTSLVRSLINGKILDDTETRDDAFIMDCIRTQAAESPSNQYIDAIRIIGEVYGRSKQPLSDSWIDYRIRSFIQNGQLAGEGNILSMKSYKVKLAD